MNTLYARCLGADFEQLHPLLQQFHSTHGCRWQGKATVIWSKNALLRGLLWLAGLPAAGDKVPVQVCLLQGREMEIWQRRFGTSAMVSQQCLRTSQLNENFGPWRLLLQSTVIDGELRQYASKSCFLGIGLPRCFSLLVQAREWCEAGRFRFDVAIALGNCPLLHYSGWLLPMTDQASGS